MAGYKFVNGSDDEVSVADVSHALCFFFICFPPVHVTILVGRLPLRCRVGYQRLSQRAQIQLPVSYAMNTYSSCCPSYSL